MRIKIFYKHVFFIIVIALLASCATTKEIKPRKKLKPISDNKLYNNIMDSTLNYSAIYFKKFSVSVNNNGKKDSYKGMMKIQKDSAIWISMTAPLGIEVARIFITQDSVKLVDRYHKKFFKGGFDIIASKFNNDFDFFTIQNILTNGLFEFPKHDYKPFVRKFRAKVKDNIYVFHTFNERKLEKKYKRSERQIKRKKESSIVYQTNYIDPDSFRITEVLIDELCKDWKLNIKYNNFVRIDGQLFPKKLAFSVEASNKKYTCKVSFSKMVFSDKVKLSFKIPSSYKEME